jgi:pseudaminic acid biosynthesis-associated methylase
VDGCEINSRAFAELQGVSGIKAHHQSIKDFSPKRTRDLAFTKTLLNHLDPESLERVYKRLHAVSSKFILLVEYYSPTPIEVEYRFHSGKLFKRDFAGERLDQYSDLRLVDYGFVYHRGEFPQDDVNWFLVQKTWLIEHPLV